MDLTVIMNLASQKRIRIGDLLVEKNMISETQLQHALQEQKLTGRKLGATLVELGYVEENALLNLLSAQLHIPFVELKQFRFDRSLVQRLPETSARRYRVMLLREDVDGLLLGMADPRGPAQWVQIRRSRFDVRTHDDVQPWPIHSG